MISMALHDVFLSHFDKETSFIDVDTHYEIMRWWNYVHFPWEYCADTADDINSVTDPK